MKFSHLEVTMSFKSTQHLIPKNKTVYTGEFEHEDWPNLLQDNPILALGSGSYSEAGFGIYHPTNGKLTRVSFNVFPVEDDDELHVKIMSNQTELLALYLTGSSGSFVTNIPLNNMQFGVAHQSSTYATGRVCIRMYFEVTDL
jgi:hypothetical protein